MNQDQRQRGLGKPGHDAGFKTRIKTPSAGGTKGFTVAVIVVQDFVAMPFSSGTFLLKEPRQIQMLADCRRNKRMIGVALSKHSASFPGLSGDGALRIGQEEGGMNRPGKGAPAARGGGALSLSLPALRDRRRKASQEPSPVFCCGHPRVVSEHEDGSIEIKITFRTKVRLLEALQEVPFHLARVETVTERVDEPLRFERALNGIEDVLDRFADLGLPEIPGGSGGGVRPRTRFYRLLRRACLWIVLDCDVAFRLLMDDSLDSKSSHFLGILEDVYDTVEEDLINILANERHLPVTDLIRKRDGNILHVDFQ